MAAAMPMSRMSEIGKIVTTTYVKNERVRVHVRAHSPGHVRSESKGRSQRARTYHLRGVVKVSIEAAHGKVIEKVQASETEVRNDVDELVG